MQWFVGVLFLGFVATVSGAPAKVADYSFHGNLQSAVASAPDLTLVGTGTAYTTETVDGAPRTVATFDRHSGFALTPTTDILASPGVYTIAMLTRFENVESFNKIIDFTNGDDDCGLYIFSRMIYPYCYVRPSGSLLDTGYHSIVLTRDANGQLKGYVDGAEQFDYDDSSQSDSVISADNTLRFFLDDAFTGGSEAYNGAVAGIRIWDTALDASAVSAIDWDAIFDDGFELTP